MVVSLIQLKNNVYAIRQIINFGMGKNVKNAIILDIGTFLICHADYVQLNKYMIFRIGDVNIVQTPILILMENSVLSVPIDNITISQLIHVIHVLLIPYTTPRK